MEQGPEQGSEQAWALVEVQALEPVVASVLVRAEALALVQEPGEVLVQEAVVPGQASSLALEWERVEEVEAPKLGPEEPDDVAEQELQEVGAEAETYDSAACERTVSVLNDMDSPLSLKAVAE